jgi:hypothetical protein
MAARLAGFPGLQVAAPLFYYDTSRAKLVLYDPATSAWRGGTDGNAV